jgi:hypothetical protein
MIVVSTRKKEPTKIISFDKVLEERKSKFVADLIFDSSPKTELEKWFIKRHGIFRAKINSYSEAIKKWQKFNLLLREELRKEHITSLHAFNSLSSLVFVIDKKENPIEGFFRQLEKESEVA